jgi:hypothetical protein
MILPHSHNRKVDMILVTIVLIVAFLWWANSSSIGDRVKQARLDGDVARAEVESNHWTRIKAGLIGLVVGAVLGSFIGIAAFGSAIAGTIPVSLIMGIWFYCANGPTKK